MGNFSARILSDALRCRRCLPGYGGYVTLPPDYPLIKFGELLLFSGLDISKQFLHDRVSQRQDSKDLIRSANITGVPSCGLE